MPDMLVKLYDLADDWSFLAGQMQLGITIRKPIGNEKQRIAHWVEMRLAPGWVSETERACSNRPVSCFIAVREQALVGFACYDATALGFFGPLGVDETCRGRGIGKALMLACLLDMKLAGYYYAIIGSVGPTEFYRKTVGAVEIPDSEPGIWKTSLLEDDIPPAVAP